MDAAAYIKRAKRDGQIVDALHVARYEMAIVDGLTVKCEGSEFPLDFSNAIRQIDAVMTMLGIDMTQPLPAPVRRDDQ